jgi:hypothetical protein
MQIHEGTLERVAENQGGIVNSKPSSITALSKERGPRKNTFGLRKGAKRAVSGAKNEFINSSWLL